MYLIKETQVKIIYSQKPELLAAELAKFDKTVTIEAEYGEVTVQGSLYTSAHHGKNSHKVCPAMDMQLNMLKADAVGISHIDLDTLLGIMRMQTPLQVDTAFASAAAYIDTHGLHRLYEVDEKLHKYFFAFWAFSENNRLPKTDKFCLDVTEKVELFINVLKIILDDDSVLIADGYVWHARMQKLEAESFVKDVGFDSNFSGLIRKSDCFINHLYTHEGKTYDFVIGYNEKNKAYTLSFERDCGLNAAVIMRKVFGDLAGGHAGIAGSPRGQTFDYDNVLIEGILDEIAVYLPYFDNM
jgi:hypothetical protein